MIVISYAPRSPIAHPRSFRLNQLTAGLAVLAILTSGCRRDPIFREMSDSTYINTMVALRKLPVGSPDTVQRARLRDSILTAFGVTAAEMESVAVRLSNDTARAAAIFRAIENPPQPSPP